jgi:hypothetical protein
VRQTSGPRLPCSQTPWAAHSWAPCKWHQRPCQPPFDCCHSACTLQMRHNVASSQTVAPQPDWTAPPNMHAGVSCCLHSSCRDSEYSTQGPQQFGAAAVRRTDSGNLGDIAAAGAALGSSLQEPAAGAGGGLNSVRHAAPAGAANAAAAAGIAGVLTEHLAAVAAAAADAVAAAAAAAGGAKGKDSGGVSAHGMLPAIGNSSCPKPQLHHHKPPAQQHELVLPVQQLGQQQQPQQRHRQQPPAHHSNHLQHTQQHSLQPSHQLRQQPGHGPHDGMPLYGGSGAGSLKDRDGSTMQQLLAEASSLSHAALHGVGLGVGLGVQASSGSLWQEGSAVTLGPGAAGALLPPLMGSKAGVAGAALHTARRSSHFGGQVRDPGWVGFFIVWGACVETVKMLCAVASAVQNAHVGTLLLNTNFRPDSGMDANTTIVIDMLPVLVWCVCAGSWSSPAAARCRAAAAACQAAPLTPWCRCCWQQWHEGRRAQ